MHQLLYDGTMAGLLTAIFDVYDSRLQEVRLCKEDQLQPDVFAVQRAVITDAVKARRVWKGLGKKITPAALDQLYYCFLSEEPGMEDILLSYVRYAFASGRSMEEDFSHPAVLHVVQTARKVWREKHRMEAFVRFSLLKDGLFYAMVSPDHNVLPLILPHFRSRYADQRWLIYDSIRKYGIHYEPAGGLCGEVHIEWKDTDEIRDALEPHDALYQQLWKDYFHHTGIPERANRKLHLRHMPLRYWRHLTEKQL
jgi:probable DNA metabolism protein